MWASLPAAFHNDGDGRKAAWRGKILDRLREVTGQEARGALPKSLERAAPYLQFLKCFNAAREKEQEDELVAAEEGGRDEMVVGGSGDHDGEDGYGARRRSTHAGKRRGELQKKKPPKASEGDACIKGRATVKKKEAQEKRQPPPSGPPPLPPRTVSQAGSSSSRGDARGQWTGPYDPKSPKSPVEPHVTRLLTPKRVTPPPKPSSPLASLPFPGPNSSEAGAAEQKSASPSRRLSMPLQPSRQSPSSSSSVVELSPESERSITAGYADSSFSERQKMLLQRTKGGSGSSSANSSNASSNSSSKGIGNDDGAPKWRHQRRAPWMSGDVAPKGGPPMSLMQELSLRLRERRRDGGGDGGGKEEGDTGGNPQSESPLTREDAPVEAASNPSIESSGSGTVRPFSQLVAKISGASRASGVTGGGKGVVVEKN